MSEESQPQQPKPESQQRISVDLPKDLTAVYANMAFISHTPAELVLDFAQVLPRSPRGRVMARVIMSPIHAKMLHSALTQNLANYEKKYGEIKLPQGPNLAKDFFRFPQDEPDDESDE